MVMWLVVERPPRVMVEQIILVLVVSSRTQPPGTPPEVVPQSLGLRMVKQRLVSLAPQMVTELRLGRSSVRRWTEKLPAVVVLGGLRVLGRISIRTGPKELGNTFVGKSFRLEEKAEWGVPLYEPLVVLVLFLQ